MYDIGSLHEANSPEDAVRLLSEDNKRIIIAGGSDVLIKIREGKLAGADLVSIYGLDELRGINLNENGDIKIGALTSFTSVSLDEIILKNIPTLADAVLMVGGPQVRNIGTVGGNTCNGVTSADSATTFMAYDTIMEVLGKDGKRYLPIEEFYVGAGKVALEQNEVLLSLNIKKESYKNRYGHYYKYSMRKAMDIATSTCSANLELSQDKTKIKDLRIAFGVAGPVPTRARKTEEQAKDLDITTQNIEKLAKNVLEELKPRDSWRASKDLREHILVQMANECITNSIIKAGGKI